MCIYLIIVLCYTEYYSRKLIFKNMTKICEICFKTFNRPKRVSFKLWDQRIVCSKECNGIRMNGQKHWGWKGDKASYSAIHKWLVSNYGIANKCENIHCQQLPSDRYEYALITGSTHTHNREAYKMLCRPCHGSYDSRLNKLNVRL